MFFSRSIESAYFAVDKHYGCGSTIRSTKNNNPRIPANESKGGYKPLDEGYMADKRGYIPEAAPIQKPLLAPKGGSV